MSKNAQVLPIIQFPDPFLRAQAEPVKAVDDDMRELARDMAATMLAARGVGLAATQVARGWRVIVAENRTEHPEHPEEPPLSAPLFFFNPTIIDAAKDIVVREEGCLSMPGVYAPVRRPAQVTVSGLDMDGKPHEIRAEGLLATCLQHEIDHLDGVLFIDHISRLRKARLLAKYEKLRAGRPL